MGKALGNEGRRFESGKRLLYRRACSLAAMRSPKPRVVGSMPTAPVDSSFDPSGSFYFAERVMCVDKQILQSSFMKEYGDAAVEELSRPSMYLPKEEAKAHNERYATAMKEYWGSKE